MDSNSSSEKKLQWLRSQVIGAGAEFRSPFGRRRLTYADTTASGQSLLYIENYILRRVLPFYGNTHTGDCYAGERTTRLLHDAVGYIKRCLGAGAAEAVIFCGAGSTAAVKRLQEVMGVAVAPTLRERVALRAEERWVVFVGPYEHHSNLLSWRRSLAEVVEIGLADDGLMDLAELKARLEMYKNLDRPMVGSFSACSNVTGIYCDTRAVARLLHQYGAFACFDFAASGPHVKISMRCGEMDGYDAIFLSPHKYLGGPGSPGILLMNKALYQLGSTCPSTCGGGTVAYVNGFNEKDTLYYADVEERENAGTPPITQTIRAALAFWVKEYIGHRTILEREHSHIKRALQRLAKNENVEVLGNTTVARQAILSFLVFPNKEGVEGVGGPSQAQSEAQFQAQSKAQLQAQMRPRPLHGPFVAKLLNDLFGIQSRGGCACAGPYGHSLLDVDQEYSLTIRSHIQKGYHGVKPGWTRLSFPFYLATEEVEFILDAVEFVASYGHTFLPVYHFNWETGSWTFQPNSSVAEALRIFSDNNNNNNNNNNKSKKNRRRIAPPTFGKMFDSLKEFDLKRSGIVQEIKSLKIANAENGALGGEVEESREFYMETARRLVAMLPTSSEPREVPKDLDLGLPFMV